MIQTIQRILLFCVLFLITSQLGKHFWPDFSYISGIRVDYLSPTLHLTDIFIGVLFLLSIPHIVRQVKWGGKYPSATAILGVLAIGIGTSLASYPIVALYGVLKVVEMMFLGYAVSYLFTKKDFPRIAEVIAGAVFVQSILVFWQLHLQSSVGGIWYYLGERTFSTGTIGISTISLYGNEILRAYGSFPHPNVLAFFMMCSSLILLVYSSFVSGRLKRLWIGVTVALSISVLFVTFSRAAIIFYIIAVIYLAYKNTISQRVGVVIILFCVVCVGLSASRFSLSILSSSDFLMRIELAYISLEIIKSHMAFGTGMLNYFVLQLPYQMMITPVLLQPVHNIYLLTLLQLGVLGAIPVCIFLKNTVLRARVQLTNRRDSNKLSVLFWLLLCSVLVLGMVDHFFLTLQQGMLMTAFIVGWVWLPSDNRA